jgi:predicted nucleic-acid-binding protein
MKITADTNVLLRAVVGDDETQARVAVETLDGAELVAIGVQSLCEFVWVLTRQYGTSRADIATAIRRLIDTHNVVVDRPVVEAGLAMLDAGGDFADGVVALDGKLLGGETFVSFDKKAVGLIVKQGGQAKLLLS